MSDNTSNNKRIAKNTLFLYIRMIFVLLVSLYSTRAILNALGVVDYGIYNVVAGFVLMFAFLNSSMTNTIQRFFNFERGNSNSDNLNKVYITSLQIQITLGIITVVLLEIIGIWYINNKMVIPVDRISAAMCVFQFSVISLFLLILQIPYGAAVVAHEKMGFYAIVSMVDVILKLFIAFILPYIPYDRLIYYGIFMLIISIANIFLYFVYAKKNFEEIRYHHVFYRQQFISMLAFSGWNAYQVQAALSGFTENIAVAFKPQLVESYAKNEFERTKNLMFCMSRLCYLMVFVLSLPISIEIEYILNMWLGGEVPEYTSIFTNLILLNMLLGSLNLPISQAIQAVGKIRIYQTVRSVIVISALPVSWLILADGTPAYMVFVVLIIVNLINQPVSMFLLRKVFNYSYLDYYRKVLLPCLLFSLITPLIPFVIHSLMGESWGRLAIVGIISILFSAGAAYFIILSKDEQYLVKVFVEKVKNKL